MSKEAWRAMLFKEHAHFVAGMELSEDSPKIDAMAMAAFDIGYDFLEKHNATSNLARLTDGFNPHAMRALLDMAEAGMCAFIKDKEAS